MTRRLSVASGGAGSRGDAPVDDRALPAAGWFCCKYEHMYLVCTRAQVIGAAAESAGAVAG
jgi:hypothetical protein